VKQHFEYYIDDKEKQNENTILYGKSIIIACVEGHKNSWTLKEKKVFFLKDTLTFKELVPIMEAKEPTIFGIYKNAVKKLQKITKKLLKKRDCLNNIIY